MNNDLLILVLGALAVFVLIRSVVSTALRVVGSLVSAAITWAFISGDSGPMSMLLSTLRELVN